MSKKKIIRTALIALSLVSTAGSASANMNLPVTIGTQKLLNWATTSFKVSEETMNLAALRVAYNSNVNLTTKLFHLFFVNPHTDKKQVQMKTTTSFSNLACQDILAPAASLETKSKYDQNDASRSEILDDSSEKRNEVLKPIRKSISTLATLGVNETDSHNVQVINAKCLQRNLVHWAEAGSLTKMETTDAFLARDRLMSEIVLTYIASQKFQKMDAVDGKKVSAWLSSIASSTMEFYQFRAGGKSKVNNHRYWAGLSVGSIGYAIASDEFKQWGERSYQVGVCQVDENGYLPLELGRGELALDYHVYALRPLQAFAQLASQYGDHVDGKCGDGLKRLRKQTLAAIDDPSLISELTGIQQGVHAKERSYTKPLQLASLDLK